MPHNYLRRFAWDGECWQAGGGWHLGLDTRDLASQGLRGEFGDYPYAFFVRVDYASPVDDEVYLGEGLLAEVNIQDAEIRSALGTLVGVAPPTTATTLLQYLVYLGTEGASPDGASPMKPLLPGRDGEAELYYPLNSRTPLVWHRRFGDWNPTGNRWHNVIRDLRRADLVRHDRECKAEAQRLKEEAQDLRKQGREKEAKEKARHAAYVETHAERVLDSFCRKYNCGPTEFAQDIPRGRAQTTITDDCSSTANWSATSGTWESSGGRVRKTSASGYANYRNTQILSDDDHYSQIVAYRTGAAGDSYPAASVRNGTGTGASENLYWCPAVGADFRFKKRVNGADTDLGSYTLSSWASGDTLKTDITGSSLTAYLNGASKGSVSDSAHSGYYYIGVNSYHPYSDGGTEFDNLVGADPITGWTHKIHGIANANLAKVFGTAKANIAKIHGT